MKDHKNVPRNSREPQKPDKPADVSSEDDTKRLRTLTVQEVERFLKEKAPGR